MHATYHVLGYCRSTVGGHDVWDPADPASGLRLQLRSVPRTSINLMNYRAVLDLLRLLLLLEAPPPPRIELRVGCYAVVQQLNGDMPVRAPHVRDAIRDIRAAQSALFDARGSVVARVAYVRDIVPPPLPSPLPSPASSPPPPASSPPPPRK